MLSLLLIETAAARRAASAPPIAANVASDYTTPTITVPYAAHPPTLDGVIREAEWKNAVSVDALQTTTHAGQPAADDVLPDVG